MTFNEMILVFWFAVAWQFQYCDCGDRPIDSWSLVDKYLRKVACISDSIALGAIKLPSDISSLKQYPNAMYPALLQSFLKDFYEVRIINLGVRDATVIEDSDEAYLLSQHYKTFTNYRFTSAIIQLGAYDTQSFYWNREKFLSGFQNLLQYTLLNGKPGLKLFICSSPPVYNTKQIHGLNAARVNTELPRLLKDLAPKFNATFIDIHKELGGSELSKAFLFKSYNFSVGKLNFQFTGDGFHPNGLGHLYIVKTILDTIFGERLCYYIFKSYLQQYSGLKYLLSEFAMEENNGFMNKILLDTTEPAIVTNTEGSHSKKIGSNFQGLTDSSAGLSFRNRVESSLKVKAKSQSTSLIKVHE